MTARLPVAVVTGFLGAGKTTLLNGWLREPALAGAAVLVNEVGAVPIDHHLVREVRGDARILRSGCVCCAVAGDLVRGLVELAAQIDRGELPAIDRVVLETTGIADPTGVIATLVQHPAVARRYTPGPLVAVVDAVAGAATVARHREAAAQVALADAIVIAKRDLADAAALAAVAAAVAARNPGAPIVTPAEALTRVAAARDDDPDALARWLRAATSRPLATASTPTHGDLVTAVACFDAPLRLGPLALWLQLITQIHGDALLRVKGLVAVEGEVAPRVLHAVGHLVFPPEPLTAWPDADHRSRLVFIARGMSAAMLRSLVENLAATLGHPLVAPAAPAA